MVFRRLAQLPLFFTLVFVLIATPIVRTTLQKVFFSFVADGVAVVAIVAVPYTYIDDG